MENEIEFLGYKVTAHCRPDIKWQHNIRDPKIVSSEEHIDLSKPHETILDMGNMEKAYAEIFGNAISKYNEKQKRKDRIITNYLEKILSDSRKGSHKNLKADGTRKPAYEFIFQIGNRDSKVNAEIAGDVLKRFCKVLIEKYPNIVPIAINLHNDEFSIDEETGQKIESPVHIHFDFVYVAHLGKSLKTGPELQSSMSAALSEMSFITSKGNGTAQMQFEEAVRHDLQDFAEQNGIKVDRTPSEKHSHKEKTVYQLWQDTNRRRNKLEKQESILEEKIKKNANIRHELNDRNLIQNSIKINQDKKEKALKQKEQKILDQESIIRTKELELELKSKAISQKEINASVLAEKEVILSDKEKTLQRQAAMIQEKLQEVRSSQKETEEKLSKIEHTKLALETEKAVFEKNKNKIQIYETICKEVNQQHLNIDKEVEQFLNDDRITFAEKLKKFVSNVKKIVTNLVLELNKYKEAFKDFWTKRSKDFRNLADEMDQKGCSTFFEYSKQKISEKSLQNTNITYKNKKNKNSNEIER